MQGIGSGGGSNSDNIDVNAKLAEVSQNAISFVSSVRVKLEYNLMDSFLAICFVVWQL